MHASAGMANAKTFMASTAIVTCFASLLAQGVSVPAHATSKQILSPSVEGVVFVRDSAIELLILFRGAPGWYRGRGATTGSERIRLSGQTFGFRFGYAGFEFSGYYNAELRTVTIGSHTIDLKAGENVVFVDETGTAGMAVLGTGVMDGRYDRENQPLAELLRRSPEVVEYLKCEHVDPSDVLNLLYLCKDLQQARP